MTHVHIYRSDTPAVAGVQRRALPGRLVSLLGVTAAVSVLSPEVTP